MNGVKPLGGPRRLDGDQGPRDTDAPEVNTLSDSIKTAAEIRAALKRAGLGPSEAADLVGMARPSMSRALRGTRAESGPEAGQPYQPPKWLFILAHVLAEVPGAVDAARAAEEKFTSG